MRSAVALQSTAKDNCSCPPTIRSYFSKWILRGLKKVDLASLVSFSVSDTIIIFRFFIVASFFKPGITKV